MKKLLIVLSVLFFLLPPFYSLADGPEAFAEDDVIVSFEYNKDAQTVSESLPEIGCKAALIAELKTGKIVYEKNAHEKMYPASTTKILTALLVLENCDLTETAVVSKRALELVPEGYSNANLQVGEELSIFTLLQALLIPSANEAANVLAEHVSGSVEAFAELCNKRAAELGCESLHFVNPNGVHDEEHYCTAYDLYLIARECRKHDAFNEIVKTQSFSVPATAVYKNEDRTFSNSNLLIMPSSQKYYYPFCTGIKTGFTTPAGQCLVSSSSYENIDLICVVLGGGINSAGLNERFCDTVHLFKYVYNNFEYKTITADKDLPSTCDPENETDEPVSFVEPAESDKESEQPLTVDPDELKELTAQEQSSDDPKVNDEDLEYTTVFTADEYAGEKPYRAFILYAAAAIVFVWIIFIFFRRIKGKR